MDAWKECVFCSYWLKYCINVDWTLLDDGAVAFYIADFLSSYFISWGKRGIEVFIYNYGFVSRVSQFVVPCVCISLLGSYIFRIVMYSYWFYIILSLFCHYVISMFLLIFFSLEYMFSDTNIATPALFWPMFEKCASFYPFNVWSPFIIIVYMSFL